jgi:hypothetical protein
MLGIHIAQPPVFEPSPTKVEIANAKLKIYISPYIDQIPAGLIQTGGEILYFE